MSTLSNSYQPVYPTETEERVTEAGVPAWKMELNAKLAAHRQRRPSSPAEQEETVERTTRPVDTSARVSQVAARVAERYAKAPSYSEFLAASAAAATAAAETAAFAARQAQDAAETFARLSADRDAAERARVLLENREQETRQQETAQQIVRDSAAAAALEPWPAAERHATVEHPEPLPARSVMPPQPARAPSLFAGAGIVDPFEEATVHGAVGLPAKLIEFPRELVAPRKSRPRAAEGPLVEATLFDPPADESQPLRIFEVEGASMVTGRGFHQRGATEAGVEAGVEADTGEATLRHETEEVSHQTAESSAPSAPEWQSIRLGEHPVSEPLPGSGNSQLDDRPGALPVLHTASIADRAMAALVDLVAVGVSFLLFVLVFTLSTPHPPAGKTALACAGGVLAALALFYQWLFMSYGGGTLGMRYARIAVCTFDDENPTRRQMRRRVFSSLLSLLPLGLGFLWAVFDEDALGWHDRMARSYQRSYR